MGKPRHRTNGGLCTFNSRPCEGVSCSGCPRNYSRREVMRMAKKPMKGKGKGGKGKGGGC